MAIVTLLTDSGESDHYVAAIKARIISVNPGVRIEDISHKIKPADIGHAAFVLRAVFRDFPKGTVHLVGVDATGNRGDVPIAVQLEDHFFVGCDNGFFGLITDKSHQQLVELNAINTISTTFPERDIFAPTAAKLASGVSITNLGKPMVAFKKMIDRQVKATKKQISGTVIRVDGMGNLITNIPRDAFEILSRDKVYTIQFGGEKFRRIHTQYNQADDGECFLVFNSIGLLEIGIYKGNASELLGLDYDSAVNIIFEE
ncbi:SAM hydrolase/SAM-dependent halogenase family protein [Parachryseolinea silvisoli]|jgi:S-adenosylmethionine hydrolase|uniref:SAM hydrolase/SAM-dependent halogenase family protein n=1 Tax=Parachryseolinea silvisoli TaxID=2873601 RepID=UPI002265D4A9|nr:SAM-dependent chlorinase/fluorinase [Parachryseolinea silvisoli]MCD9014804.1 SAM-dependent chlorinase/fluorinase [Parachryseolinea silvisoli]